MRLAISVQAGNYTREIIEKSGVFNLSVLTQDVPFEVIRHFGMQSGRDLDKFQDFSAAERTENGLYCLTEHVNAVFSCKVLSRQDLGSHVLFIGEVTQARAVNSAPSCTYAYYHSHIKPKG